MTRFNVGARADVLVDADEFDDLERPRRPLRRRPARHDDEPGVDAGHLHPPDADARDADTDDPDLPNGAVRSTYQESRSSQGPQPPPPWLVTTSAALDYERGVVKTGKEADVHLVERVDPTTGTSCLLAAKRYRSSQHRMFHRDAGYLEGRSVRRSRENRAMATRTSFGRELIAGQWASAEFAMLGRLWSAGVAVPYPVQLGYAELLIEFIGDADGTAAPRLAELRPDSDELDDLWRQCRDALATLAASGFAHGDLSAYNVLVHHNRFVMIDLPQAVDIVGNPQGAIFLQRDCENICRWFAARGQPDADADELVDELRSAAGMPRA
jgi:RIO kinase 1